MVRKSEGLEQGYYPAASFVVWTDVCPLIFCSQEYTEHIGVERVANQHVGISDIA